MSELENLEKKVLDLSENERIALILKLLESLETKGNTSDTMNEWVKEAELRYQAWKKGDVQTLSEEEVSARVQERLNK